MKKKRKIGGLKSVDLMFPHEVANYDRMTEEQKNICGQIMDFLFPLSVEDKCYWEKEIDLLRQVHHNAKSKTFGLQKERS